MYDECCVHREHLPAEADESTAIHPTYRSVRNDDDRFVQSPAATHIVPFPPSSLPFLLKLTSYMLIGDSGWRVSRIPAHGGPDHVARAASPADVLARVFN